jgi:integrase
MNNSLSLGQYTESIVGIEEILENYLHMKEYSPGLVRNLKSYLHRFFEQVPKHPLEVKLADWLDFARFLNTQDMCFASKKTYRASLKVFFDYVEFLAASENLNFRNPIPKLEYSRLNPDTPNTQREKRDRQKKYIPDEILSKILDVARGRNFGSYLMFLLLMHCGMRALEMLTIKRSDIHLEERWLETGLEPGARKSNKLGTRRIVYFFPESVKFALKQYLVFAPKSEWLFPAKQKCGDHLCINALHARINRLAQNIDFHFSTHWFRKTLNTNRKYRMKCSKEDRQKLLNHLIRDAIECYDEAEILTLRNIYDEFHPYEK